MFGLKTEKKDSDTEISKDKEIANDGQDVINGDIVSKVTDKIAALDVDSTPDSELAEEDDVVESGDTEDDSTPTNGSADETDSGAVEDSDSTPESKTADDTDDETGGDTSDIKLEIPDSFYRAAIHQGWKPEEIQEFCEKTPELALRTFGKIHESTNKLSSQFAELGRIKMQSVKTEQKIEDKPGKVAETKVESIDIAQLKEAYKDDPIVDVIVQQQKQYQNVLERLDAQTEEIRQTRQSVNAPNVKEQELIQQQVSQFFGADDMKIYTDFYGSDKDAEGNAVQPESFMPGQRANRAAIIQMADQMIAGAELQGREMSVSEALECSHMVLTAPMVEQRVRSKIKKAVVKRNKGITLKGSGKRKTAGVDKSGELTQDELEARTASRISKLFK